MRIRSTWLAVTAAVALGATLLPSVAAPILAGAPCRAVRTSSGTPATTHAAIMDAIGAEPDDEAALTVTFTGTCAEGLYLSRLGPTTIVGRRTRTTGTPTLDATGTDGPAITVYSRPVTLRGFTVTGGSGANGGDPAGPAHGGGLYIESSTVTLIDMRITRNATRNDGQGGGIFASAVLGGLGSPPSPARLVIRGRTVITDNTTDAEGGGIHAEPGVTVRVTEDARIHANHATFGGGISMTGSDTKTTTLLLRDRATVTDNDASANGGGIHTTGAVGTTIANGASVQTNTASVGGGLYIEDVGSLRLLGLVAGNTASVGGGGIYLSTALMLATATARITGNEGGTGGGIAGLDSSVGLTGTLVSGNRATTDEGGGIFLNGDIAGLTADGARITGNRARTSGGGIYLKGTAAAELTDTAVTRNRAGYDANGPVADGPGGGIALIGGSTLTIRGASLVVANRARSGVLVPGAGISAKASTVTIGRGATIRGNRFDLGGDGGGIGIANGTLTVSGPVTIEANRAPSGNGGGIRATSSTTTLTRVVVADNTAGQKGGGISVSAGLAAIGGTIRGNTSGSDGGGIAIDGDTAVAQIEAATVSGNTASFGGGGIAVIFGAAFIRDSLVRGNTASFGGGGIAAGGPTQIDDTVVAGNRASFDGGGLTVTDTFSMAGGEVRDNRSERDGGGLSIFTTEAVTITGTKITGNDAPWEGGGISLRYRSGFSLGGGATVKGNIARRHGGGGLYIQDSTDWPCSAAVSGHTPNDVVGVSGFSRVVVCP